MKNKKGFTLVELLAVIAILAVLVLLAMPNVLKLFNEAKKSSFITEAQEIAKVSTSKYVKESLGGKRVNKISSEDDTKLDLSGGDVDYYLELDNKGNIEFLEVSNDSFCLQTYKDYKDITSEDIKDGKCDPSDRLTPEERKKQKDAELANEKYSKNEYLKTTSTGTTYFGISNFDKTKINKIYTLNTPEEPIKSIPENVINSWDVSQAQNESIMMWTIPSDIDGMYDLYIGQEGGIIANKSSYYLFYDFINATEIDVSNLITSKSENISYMFSNSKTTWTGGIPNVHSKISNIIGLEKFDTSNVTNMKETFENLYSITNLNISNWDTSKVKNMENMFRGSTNLKFPPVENWNVESLENMDGMFWAIGYYDENFYADLSKWKTSNLNNISRAFSYSGFRAKNVTINLTNFNVSKVTNVWELFDAAGCHSDNFSIIGLDNWEFDSLNSLKGIFSSAGSNATNWSIGDLSKWDLHNITNLEDMFSQSGRNANLWYVGDISNWDTQNVDSFYRTFAFAGDSAKEIRFDISNWNMSSATNMENFFLSNSGERTMTIPKTNSNGLENTNKIIYGKDSSISYKITNKDKFSFKE